MGGYIGGDPGSMTGGARSLHRAGRTVESVGVELGRVLALGAGAVGHGELSDAVVRLGAALGSGVEDTGTQATVAAGLADVAADDLRRADGQG